MQLDFLMFCVAATMCGNVFATSQGSKDLNVRQIGSTPYACLPEGAPDIDLWSASVSESVTGVTAPQSRLTPVMRWAIRLEPEAKPFRLAQGRCIAFAQRLEGYEAAGPAYPLEPEKTYAFSVRAVGPQGGYWGGQLYEGVFCVQHNNDGSVSYLPYVYHADGTITYPPCSKYGVRPAAPDGIIPPLH